MDYSVSDLQEKVERYGELFVVLDSGKEYVIHGKEGNVEWHHPKNDEIYVEGRKPEDDEYLKVEFPVDAVEHAYSHHEV